MCWQAPGDFPVETFCLCCNYPEAWITLSKCGGHSATLHNARRFVVETDDVRQVPMQSAKPRLGENRTFS